MVKCFEDYILVFFYFAFFNPLLVSINNFMIILKETKKMLRCILLLSTILLSGCSNKNTSNEIKNNSDALKLWYNQPASSWMREALL